MDFSLSQDQEVFRQRAHAFCQDVLREGVQARIDNKQIPHDVIRQMGDHGFLGVTLPKNLGGAGADTIRYVCMLREIASVDASIAVTVAVTNMVGEVLKRFGGDAQHDHIRKLASGEYFAGAFALSEPSSGSDAASLTTRAQKAKDGYILNGQKMWITSGDQAGVIIVWARTGDEGAKGVSCFAVAGETPGLTPGKSEPKMGLGASHTVALNLEDVWVPQNALLGEFNRGFRVAMSALDGGRIGISAQALGMGFGALTALQKEARGSDFKSAVQRSQHLSFQLADMATQLDAAWLLTLRAAALKDEGKPFSTEAAMAKVTATETANRVLRSAHTMAQSHHLACSEAIERAMRDCRVTQIYEGTSEIQRLVISRNILREAA